jgi:hypothetical protein
MQYLYFNSMTLHIYLQLGRGLASNSSLEDSERIEYIRSFIGGTLNAIR